MIDKFGKVAPERVRTRDVLEYFEYLRMVRTNGDAAVNRALAIIRGFFKALVAMEYMNVQDNPMIGSRPLNPRHKSLKMC